MVVHILGIVRRVVVSRLSPITDFVRQSCYVLCGAVASSEVIRATLAPLSVDRIYFVDQVGRFFCRTVYVGEDAPDVLSSLREPGSRAMRDRLSLHALRAEIWLTVYRAHLHGCRDNLIFRVTRLFVRFDHFE